jgi:hypothetical protein
MRFIMWTTPSRVRTPNLNPLEAANLCRRWHHPVIGMSRFTSNPNVESTPNCTCRLMQRSMVSVLAGAVADDPNTPLSSITIDLGLALAGAGELSRSSVATQEL